MRTVIAVLFVFMLSIATTAVAQEATASLAGSVTDPAGASLAGAFVTVTNTRTKEVLTFDADADGRFAFEKLEPGPYVVEARAAAFAATSRELFLKPGAREEVALHLTLSPVSESVTVKADL